MSFIPQPTEVSRICGQQYKTCRQIVLAMLVKVSVLQTLQKYHENTAAKIAGRNGNLFTGRTI
jgi:hypothetical protein